MESLAYLELALVCEAPAESKIFDAPNWQNLSSQTYVRLLSLALMLSVLSAASSAFAQIDPGNPNLRSVQDRLRELGYFPRSSTGQLGPVTKQALTNFQRDYQLSLTGRPDRATVIALNSFARDDRAFNTIYTNYRELRFGDAGAGVSALQRRLQQLGYFSARPTGSFREVTQNAVRYFQRINRLRVTGVADRQTLALLFGSTRPVPPVTLPGNISGNGGCKGLRFGDTGATVDLIQRQLKALGYFEGGVDGKFRERTLYAVTRFQQDYNLVSDGCADTATLTAIDAQMRQAQITSWTEENDQQSNAGDFLELGDRGRQVEFVQRRLQQLGYYRSQIHGWFDRPTQAALIRFQRDSGLFGTGRVDRTTRSALRQGNRQAAQPQPPVVAGLRRGDTGPAVRQLQSALRSLGKNPGPVNGVFGAETELAVLSFQEERNLSPATGIATPATLAAIQNGLGGRLAVPAVPISSSFQSRSSIQQLQRRLQDLGFYTGSISGVFDTPTRDALDRAQRSYGVSSDDLLSQTF
ncbi:peptidoglycan-binding protein [Microcoleus vaginatus DQ-U2]|uniref:peptidoglycan-binding domain-containing protein n=1 Tax=Microcoleus vaginatus TaxID=119532 RepID=UPI001684A20C|nr:peptidoglycan-binding protein [Microcoleus sp. FACHB-DQ6]